MQPDAPQKNDRGQFDEAVAYWSRPPQIAWINATPPEILGGLFVEGLLSTIRNEGSRSVSTERK